MLLFYDEETRRRYVKRALFSLASVFLLFFIIGIITNASRTSGKSEDDATIIHEVPTEQPNTNQQEAPTEPPQQSEPEEPQIEESQLSQKLYPVVNVVDGDTIDISDNGTIIRIRLIGVNTPETKDSRKPVECFGYEASNYLQALLSGKSVSIEVDPTQSDVDIYGRLLRYVYLDGQDVGLSIIANGYGHEYTFNIPHAKQTEYKAAERSAESQDKGLWSLTTCNGNV